MLARSIALALALSVTGVSTSLVLCVVGCADEIAPTAATHACHDERGDGVTAAAGNTGCAHGPGATVGGVEFAFDGRSQVAFAPPSVAPLLLATIAVTFAPRSLVVPRRHPPTTSPLVLRI